MFSTNLSAPARCSVGGDGLSEAPMYFVGWGGGGGGKQCLYRSPIPLAQCVIKQRDRFAVLLVFNLVSPRRKKLFVP